MTTFDMLRARTDFLTVEETAKLLNVHKVSLYRLIKAGKLPVVKLGPAMTRIVPSTLADFLEKRNIVA